MAYQNNLEINFCADSIGYLDVETMNLKRINLKQHQEIFEHIKEPFDWYFHGEIMVISDPVPAPRKNWNKTVDIAGQVIDCPGRFIIFFNFIQIKNLYNVALSLTIRQFDELQNELEITNYSHH